MRKLLIFVVALTGALSTSAIAGSFTSSDVTNFVTAISKLEALEDKFPEVDLSDSIGSDGDILNLVSDDGTLFLFQLIGTKLKGNNEVFKAMDAAVKESGFSSYSNFSVAADSIMMAYIATQTDTDELAQMKSMTASMPEAMMPPGLKEQMASIEKLMGAVERVPADDLATIKPHLDDLNRAFD
ncbi:MAG: hypothetical protein AAF986_05040 [Pseudomonadota bacterium]